MLLQGLLIQTFYLLAGEAVVGATMSIPASCAKRRALHALQKARFTGLEVSEVGYGAWGIGKDAWLGAEDDESVRALHRAIDFGLNFIDTALAYGDGHSER